MLSLKKGIDQFLNRLFGIYRGISPRNPRKISVPLFVDVIENMPVAERIYENTMRQGIVFRRPLVVADEQTWEIAGDDLESGLRALGYDVHGTIIDENTQDEVDCIVQGSIRFGKFLWERAPHVSGLDRQYGRITCGLKRHDVVCAVGGGSVIDVAQYAAYRLNLPWISIPTSLAHDGFASQFSVLQHHDGEHTFTANVPLGVLVDVSLVNSEDSLPRIRAGIGDLLSNITAGMDWQLAADLPQGSVHREPIDVVAYHAGCFGAQYVLHSITDADFPGPDYHPFIEDLAVALIQSGEAMGRYGSSRPCSGFEHKFYHAWRELGNPRLQHGEIVAIGSLISCAAHNQYLEEFRTAFEKIGLPHDAVSLQEMSIRPQHIMEALRYATAIKPDRYTILEKLGDEKMTDAVREVYE